MKAFAVLLAFVVACSAVHYYTFQCGNHRVEGSETCDDGNTAPNDGCGVTCQVEPGYECYYDTAAQRSVCSAKCGDGYVAPVEECDDGNLYSGDGCSSTCDVEDSHTCVTGPQGYSVCAPKCGDGRISVGETCDGGNLNTPAGCYHCQVFKGYICDANVPTGSCTGICGDGYQSTGEQCDDGNLNPYDSCGVTPVTGQASYCTASNRNSDTKWPTHHCSPKYPGCVAGWECDPASTLPTPPTPITATPPYHPCTCVDTDAGAAYRVTVCGSGTEADPLVCTDLGTEDDCAYCGHYCPTTPGACGPSTGTWDRMCYDNGGAYVCGCDWY